MEQNIIDFILKEIMGGKEPTTVQKQFMLEDYEPGLKFVIGNEGGGTVFEVVENNLNTITIKPLGTNCLSKSSIDFDKMTETHRYIKDNKIVEVKN